MKKHLLYLLCSAFVLQTIPCHASPHRDAAAVIGAAVNAAVVAGLALKIKHLNQRIAQLNQRIAQENPHNQQVAFELEQKRKQEAAAEKKQQEAQTLEKQKHALQARARIAQESVDRDFFNEFKLLPNNQLSSAKLVEFAIAKHGNRPCKFIHYAQTVLTAQETINSIIEQGITTNLLDEGGIIELKRRLTNLTMLRQQINAAFADKFKEDEAIAWHIKEREADINARQAVIAEAKKVAALAEETRAALARSTNVVNAIASDTRDAARSARSATEQCHANFTWQENRAQAIVDVAIRRVNEHLKPLTDKVTAVATESSTTTANVALLAQAQQSTAAELKKLVEKQNETAIAEKNRTLHYVNAPGGPRPSAPPSDA